MIDDLWWPEEETHHIQNRDKRYPGATNVQPEWTFEAASDPHVIVRNPDPKSQMGAIRMIGYSHTAGFVLTIIVDSVDHAGLTA